MTFLCLALFSTLHYVMTSFNLLNALFQHRRGEITETGDRGVSFQSPIPIIISIIIYTSSLISGKIAGSCHQSEATRHHKVLAGEESQSFSPTPAASNC